LAPASGRMVTPFATGLRRDGKAAGLNPVYRRSGTKRTKERRTWGEKHHGSIPFLMQKLTKTLRQVNPDFLCQL
ncbi:MAG: hypothetical protein VXY45_03360, partial [Pseudomonadota bacterium]|nr:hypothetical protein [Pseudomonadota bacterium]